MAKEESKSKALAIVEAPYSALMIQQDDVALMINEELDGELGVFDIDRIKIPSSGITSFSVPNLEGETDMVKEIEGIIIYKKSVRAYWEKSYDDVGAAPPNCSSDNAISGDGEPGGTCKKCDYSQFGTAINKDDTPGKGQACKLMMLVFILGEDGFLPKIVVCPPTSVAPMRKYFVRLLDKGIRSSTIITKLSLEKDKNDKGIEYSKVLPAIVGKLDEETLEKVQVYAATIRNVLAKEGLKEEDFESETKEDF
ncbi:MAG: hypothetical protein KAJ19_00520 [Gammaproteobacteria bacterium]|nr:hypothetical protein [Gammaproteobacteria bacterium]